MNPFAASPDASIASIGESALIARIREWLGPANPPEPAGIGDDCAVFPAPPDGCQQLITTDPVIYGQHFDDSVSPALAAAKLAKRNLSDIAAMGGQPILATLSLALDPRVSLAWLEAFYRELARCAARYQFSLVGGDISSAHGFLGAFLTLVGQTLPGARHLPRHQAVAGCPIYVTGALGGTRRRKHLEFEPRLAEGQWLARQSSCVACTDLSDGLGKDFANLLAPGARAEIDARLVPLGPDAHWAAERSGHSPLHHALNDGEDFELLFALAANADPNAFEASWAAQPQTPLARIGSAAPSDSSAPSRLFLRNAPPDTVASGYEHLR